MLMYVYNYYNTIDQESSAEAAISSQPEQPGVECSSGHEEDLSVVETDIDLESPSAAQIVEAGIAQGRLDIDSVPVDQRTLDEAEEALIQEFVRVSCKCDLGPNNQPCSTTITREHYQSVRCQMAELSRDELDLVVLGQVMAGCFSDATSSHRGLERGKLYTVFHHGGVRICLKTFLFLHTIGYWRYKAIKASLMANGVTARVHRNKGKGRKLGLTLEQTQDIIQFIMNYAGAERERERGRGEGEGERGEGRECMCTCACVCVCM